ncbi:prophage regulatory protein [Dyella sp. SG562]|uniref:helix-turn-helix transcriptional regulator n=1 Tax=Dyella sp. SG562 TaxID=2587017 RepID=UPI00142117B0|nr:AlpA family phage regulatory protein [Dyella sp. SG562]NII73201.1 prophage regulatory protein [Dyella sp. SG562]
MTEKRLIPLPEVTRLTGLKRTAIYERIARKEFPPVIKLGSTSRWLLSEVEAWIDQKVAARNQREDHPAAA